MLMIALIFVRISQLKIGLKIVVVLPDNLRLPYIIRLNKINHNNTTILKSKNAYLVQLLAGIHSPQIRIFD